MSKLQRLENIPREMNLKLMSSEEISIELERCKNSVSYFYNNYCRKDDMPDYSEEQFQKYIEQAKTARLLNGFSRRGKVMLMREFPITPNEIMMLQETKTKK